MQFLKNINGNLKDVLKGSFSVLVFKAIGILLNYSLLLFIANEIGVTSVGYYNLSITSLIIFTTVFSIGINFSVIRLIAEFKSKEKSIKNLYKKAFGIIFLVAVIGSILLYFSSEVIAKYLLKNDNYIGIIKTISYITPMYVLTIFNIEFLRGLQKIPFSEYLRSVHLFLITLIVLLFLKSNLTDFSPISAFALAVIFTFVLSVFGVIKSLKNNVVKSVERSSLQEIIKPSIPLMIMGTAAFVLSEIGLYLLEYFKDTNAVGNYSIIYKISIAASLIYTILTVSVGPKIADLFWKKDTSELKKIILSSSKILVFVSLPISIILVLFSDAFLELFNTSIEFKTPLIVLIIGQFLYAITGVAGIYLMVSDKQKIFRNLYIIAAVLNVALCLVLIPEHGVLGASISISISYVFLNILCNFYLFKEKLI